VINAPDNFEDNKYISGLSMNRKPYTKNWLSHKELTKGVILDFKMSGVSNKTRELVK
jgi:putative alpha-1,2-mannosidase